MDWGYKVMLDILCGMKYIVMDWGYKVMLDRLCGMLTSLIVNGYVGYVGALYELFARIFS
jgi:hypothetical protein